MKYKHITLTLSNEEMAKGVSIDFDAYGKEGYKAEMFIPSFQYEDIEGVYSSSPNKFILVKELEGEEGLDFEQAARYT